MLLGPNGKPIKSSYVRRSSDLPMIGEIAAPWIESNITSSARYPLTNGLSVDTSKLTLNDYRMMLDHYQVSSSLTLLTFMLHQIEWRVECDNIKAAKWCEDNLRAVWTRLIRAMSQAFWAGFSPCALQWENDIASRKTVLTKIKDLKPEESRVHWKSVEAVAAKRTERDGDMVQSGTQPKNVTPKVYIFDGIDSGGYPHIPVSNSFWYPLLMSNGDYYGKKLLKAAYQPWFFSNLLHYFGNRYYERFGEPVVVARAPFEEKVRVANQDVPGNVLMAGLARLVRNGSSIVMPNTRAQNGLDGVDNYEYTLEYLESQMRGADFERYHARLDQEISLALFTPLLMTNTGDSGGSFNLGIVHKSNYDNMISAVGGDVKEYIDKYILWPMARINFGPNCPRPRWEFRKPGKVKEETLRTVVLSLLTKGNGDKGVKVDLTEVGQELGMTLEEVELVTAATGDEGTGTGIDPGAGTGTDKRDQRPDKKIGRGTGTDKPAPSTTAARAKLAAAISSRLAGQFVRALREDEQVPRFDLGYARMLRDTLESDQIDVFAQRALGFVETYYEIERESPEQLESKIRETIATGIENLLCHA